MSAPHRLARISLWPALLFLATMLSGSRIESADDGVAAAESAAQAAAATPEGKTYGQEVSAAFGRDQGASIQACAKEVKRPDLSDFQVFVRVGAAGQVEEVLVKPSTNLAVCLQGKLKSWKLGAPLTADTWARIEVKLKAK